MPDRPPRISILSHVPANAWSGGRFHAWLMAHAAAQAGCDVQIIGTNVPVWHDDFECWPGEARPRLRVVKQFHAGLAQEPADLVVLVPHRDPSPRFYNAVADHARLVGAKRAMINFESGNWFNALAPAARPLKEWHQWIEFTSEQCLVLSSAHESMKWAQSFYTRYPDTTKHAVWEPGINAPVADMVSRAPERRIVLISRWNDIHKGGADVTNLLHQDLAGATLDIIAAVPPSGSVWRTLQRAASEAGMAIELHTGLTELAKFELLARASALAFLSRFEGFGLPPVEAAYVGCPVVAYDLPVLREVIGDAGTFVEPGDIRAIRAGLAATLDGALNVSTEATSRVRMQMGVPARAAAIRGLVDDYLCSPSPIPYPRVSPSRRLLRRLFRTNRVHVSSAVQEGQVLRVRGWVRGTLAPERMTLQAADGMSADVSCWERRDDVLHRHPDQATANCGFTAVIPAVDALDKSWTARVTDESGRIFADRLELPPAARIPKVAPTSVATPFKMIDEAAPAALILCHVELFPATQGNRVVIHQLLQQLRARGLKVILAMIPAAPDQVMADADLYADCCDELHVVKNNDAWTHAQIRDRRMCIADRGTPMLDALIRSICGTRNIRCCIAQYVHLASSLSAVPNDVPTAVMTHDVIHRLANQDVELAEKRVCTAEEEADMLRHAGTIIAINNAEHDLLASMLPDREVVTVGMAVDQPPTIVAPPTGPPSVLFIGAANPMNVHGIETFIDFAWPTIREAHPSARLRLVGNVCTAITTTSPDHGIELAGRVDELQTEYAGASVVINCTTMGTGLKIKCIEALGHGCPLVTTPNGAEGIPGQAGKDWIMTPDVPSMGPAIASILSDKAACSQLREAAASIASSALHPAVIYQPLWDALELEKDIGHGLSLVDSPTE